MRKLESISKISYYPIFNDDALKKSVYLTINEVKKGINLFGIKH